MGNEERIYDKISELQRELHEMNDRQRKLEGYIGNDEATGEAGVVKKQHQFEDRLTKIEDRDKLRKAYYLFALAIGGAIVWVIDQLASILPSFLKQ